jgi:hypothetical protein
MSSTDKKAVLLTEWGTAHFDPPPSLWTLRRMAREGLIRPKPRKVGKAYYVQPDAEVIDPNQRPSLVQRMKAA